MDAEFQVDKEGMWVLLDVIEVLCAHEDEEWKREGGKGGKEILVTWLARPNGNA